MLFPSSTGTVRSPHNFRRHWRDARSGSGFEWVTPHAFRNSVATLIDREYSSKQAAAQLGHAGPGITEKDYIAKASETPDVTDALGTIPREIGTGQSGRPYEASDSSATIWNRRLAYQPGPLMRKRPCSTKMTVVKDSQ
ncbi:tyrosine-type recombinase/integrase [Arthrobacter dokdonensis]|uniref:tyrosine-type recombinase/integrase n=1 Tax=Arthrobacter dokdonellae TaxID=2211210 RepID=UPI000DE5A8CA